MLTKGDIEKKLGYYDQSFHSYMKALALQPNAVKAILSVGTIELMRGNFDAAETSLKKALESDPHFEDSYLSLIELYAYYSKIDKFEHFIKTAVSFSEKPDYLFELSFSLLRMKNFSEGLKHYEHRLSTQKTKKNNKINLYDKIPIPEWNGIDTLEGKKLIVCTEQGFGDTLQFCRYLLPILESSCDVTLISPEPLKELLHSLHPKLNIICTQPSIVIADYKICLMSLPHKLGLANNLFEIKPPYLFSTAAKQNHWRMHLPANSRPKIGLAWSGNKEHKNDKHRSLALKALSPFLPSGFQYVVVQKYIPECDIDELNKRNDFLNLSSIINNFSDTAAICSQLDLIITVDSAPAHLAGALKLPTWLLISFDSDWRWFSEGTESPWYPSSMRIFRQTKYSDWSTPLHQMQEELLAWAAARNSCLG